MRPNKSTSETQERKPTLKWPARRRVAARFCYCWRWNLSHVPMVAIALVVVPLLVRAEENTGTVAGEVAQMLLSEGLPSPTGINADSFGSSDELGFQSQYRPGTFSGGQHTDAQIVRSAGFSTALAPGLTFKMTSIEGALVPFASYGPSGSAFTSRDYADDESPFYPGIRSALSFHHNLSASPSTRQAAWFAFDDSRSAVSRQFQLEGQKFKAGFSRLSIGQIDAPNLIKDVTHNINKSFAARSALGASNKPLLNIKDMRALRGVEQRDGYLNFTPTKDLSFAAEFNDIETREGDAHLQDYKFAFGKFSLTASQRTIGRSLSDTVLRGMGRDDLIALKGSEATEWTAFLPLFLNANGAPLLSLTHFRKDETIDKFGNIATATECHVRKNSVVIKPSSSTTFQFTEVETESGNVLRAAGVDLDRTVTQTYQLNQKFGDHTTTVLTRNLTVTDKGDEAQQDIRTEAVTLHVDSKPSKQLAVVGDWNRSLSSVNGEAADAKLKVTAPLSKAFAVSAEVQDKYSDLNGVEQHQAYTVSYCWNNVSKVSITSRFDHAGKPDAMTTTRSHVIAFSPTQGTTFEYTLGDTESLAAPSFLQKLTFRQKLQKSLSLVARRLNSSSSTVNDQTVNTLFFDWTKPKSPYSLQAGYETRQRELKQVQSDASQGTPSSTQEDDSAMYVKFSGKPDKTLSFGGSFAERYDLGDEPVRLWDWNVTKSLGKKMKLTAKGSCNRQNADRLDDSVIPFSKTFTKTFEQNYGLDFPVSRLPLLGGEFTANLGYATKKDLTAHTISDELSLSLVKKLDAKNKLSLKLARGVGTVAGEPDDYSTINFSYGVHIGEVNEFSISGRYTDNSAFAPSEEGKVKVDLTLRKVF